MGGRTNQRSRRPRSRPSSRASLAPNLRFGRHQACDSACDRERGRKEGRVRLFFSSSPSKWCFGKNSPPSGYVALTQGADNHAGFPLRGRSVHGLDANGSEQISTPASCRQGNNECCTYRYIHANLRSTYMHSSVVLEVYRTKQPFVECTMYVLMRDNHPLIFHE